MAVADVFVGSKFGSKSQIARKRWEILATALRKGKVEYDAPVESIRRFSSFGLLEMKKIENVDEPQVEWQTWSCPLEPNTQVTIRYLRKQLSPNELSGFNNTGNVCIWPSEEILAYYCVKHSYLFDKKTICEIGGGMTCLAGTMLAATSNAKEVLLTDGNTLSVTNVEKIIERNENFGSTIVTTRVLRWDLLSSNEDLKGRFDYVMCADCLFFPEGRLQLAETIVDLLKANGQAFIFAPARSSTLTQFEELAKDLAIVERIDNYDVDVWKLHSEFKSENSAVYEEDLHYPILLHLRKE